MLRNRLNKKFDTKKVQFLKEMLDPRFQLLLLECAKHKQPSNLRNLFGPHLGLISVRNFGPQPKICIS